MYRADFYHRYYVPFAQCLTDMERYGIMVDKDYLKQQEERAKIERLGLAEALDHVFILCLSEVQKKGQG